MAIRASGAYANMIHMLLVILIQFVAPAVAICVGFLIGVKSER